MRGCSLNLQRIKANSKYCFDSAVISCKVLLFIFLYSSKVGEDFVFIVWSYIDEFSFIENSVLLNN